MFKTNQRKYLRTACLFVLISVIGLWSWNALSELFSLPHAQFKHVIAAFSLLFIIRWSLFSSNLHWKKGNA